MKHFFFICDVDSQIYVCRYFADELRQRGHDCTLLIDSSVNVSSHVLASLANHKVVRADPTAFSLSSMAFRYDAIGVFLTGSGIYRFRQNIAAFSDLFERRPMLFCGFNGIVLEKFEEGITWRLGYDVICLNGPRDERHFRDSFGNTDYGTQPIALTGLNRGALKGASLPWDERKPIAVFAEQVAIPAEPEMRRSMVRILANLAARSPNWEVVIKPRVAPGEKTFHKVKTHISATVAEIGNLPDNVHLSYEPLDTLLPRARYAVTISSTAIFDAISYGARPVIMADFGASTSLGTVHFIDSGLLCVLSELPSLDELDGQVCISPEWVKNVGYGPEFSVDNLLAALDRGAVEQKWQRVVRDFNLLPLRANSSSSPPVASEAARSPTTKKPTVPQTSSTEKKRLMDDARSNPEDPAPLRRLAESYINEHKWAAAAEALEKAAHLCPDDKNIQMRLKAVKAGVLTRQIRLSFSELFWKMGRWIPFWALR